MTEPEEISPKRPRGRPRKYNRIVPSNRYYYSDSDLRKRLNLVTTLADKRELERALAEREINRKELKDALSANVVAPVSDSSGAV